ncbi:MAG TPA: hypothetical protein VL285_15365 [Bryobacteraceae bacterium]|nr:hypothetical protein [Bryobacteraceae bacterium]
MQRRAEQRADRADQRADRADARADRFDERLTRVEKQLKATGDLLRNGIEFVAKRDAAADFKINALIDAQTRADARMDKFEEGMADFRESMRKFEARMEKFDARMEKSDAKFERLLEQLGRRNTNGR